MYCIDADCALRYLMSDEANEIRKRTSLNSTDGIDNRSAVSLPQWAYAPDGNAHVIAFSENARNQKHGFESHRVSQTPSPGSLIMLDREVAIPSPEYCFLRLAKTLSLPELVKAGMLLCSSFSIDNSGCIVRRHRPLTSARKLGRYIANNSNIHGVKNARRALRYILDGAASPPEIDSSIILTLRVSQGGYACPLPELNGHIELNSKVARSLGYKDCYCDLLWRKWKCAVEYTSELHHEGYEKQVEDEIRRAAIESMGYRLFFLTKNQLYSQPAFEGFARPLVHQLGKRNQNTVQKMQTAQYALRHDLLYEPSWILRRACM